MIRWNTITSLAFLSSVLIACGGGSSFDSLPLPAEQQPGSDQGGNGVPGAAGGPEPVDDQGGQGAPNPGDGQSGNDSQGENDVGPSGQEMPVEVPIEVPVDEPLTVGAGSTARVLLSEDGPTIGVPGATMESISQVDGNGSGTLLIGGTYRTASNGTRESAVWGGPHDNLSLLFQEFARVPGQADNVRFSRAVAVDVSTNGSFGMRATLSGAEVNDVLLRRTIDATTWSLIAEEGDALPGSPEPLSLVSFGRTAFSDTGIAFSRGVNVTQNDVLWASDGETTRFVAAEERVVSAPPTFGAEACPIHLENHSTSGFSSNSDKLFDISDRGVVVFESRVGPRFGNVGCQGRSIMSFDKGLYSSIVHEGQVVPNAPNSRFSDVYLFDVLPDGGAIVGSRILTPTGGPSPDSKSSLWLFPTQGAPSLILLQGEEVQAGTNSFLIGPTALRGAQITRQLARDGSRLAIELATGENLAVVGGPRRTGQPYPTIPSPGASNLTFIQRTNGDAPMGFPSVSFFSQIADTALFGSGVLFHGVLQNAETGQIEDDALWAADLEGSLTSLLKTGDQVSIAGAQQSIQLPRIGNRRNFFTREIAGTAGALVVGGDLISGFSNAFVLLVLDVSGQ